MKYYRSILRGRCVTLHVRKEWQWKRGIVPDLHWAVCQNRHVLPCVLAALLARGRRDAFLLLLLLLFLITLLLYGNMSASHCGWTSVSCAIILCTCQWTSPFWCTCERTLTSHLTPPHPRSHVDDECECKSLWLNIITGSCARVSDRRSCGARVKVR